jgi:hypothetical protein
MRSLAARAAVVVATSLIAFAAACGDVTANVLAGPEGVGVDGGLAGDGSASVDGAGFCNGAGPFVQLPQGTCTGDLGKRSFLFALCACTNGDVSGVLRTDSFHSLGGATPGTLASIGTNGAFSANSRLDVRGSIWSRGDAASPAIALASRTSAGAISNELHAGGALRIDGTFTAGADVYAGGGVDLVSGGLSTPGRLHVPQGAPTNGVTSAGGIVREAVDVPPPCDCQKPLDIAAVVSGFASDNDDARAGITSKDLDGTPSNATKTLTLPCGRYAFDAIRGDAITLRLTGRTAIFVATDLDVTSALAIELGPQAELDLFIARDFHLNGTAIFGSTKAPAKVRVYIGGASVTLSGQATVGANVYAPNADLAFASAYEMSGALFAKRFAFSGDFTIHYDEAIIETQGCQPPASSCSTCHDCSGATPSCKNGSCAPCQTSADCCAPLVCHSGSCVLDLR